MILFPEIGHIFDKHMFQRFQKYGLYCTQNKHCVKYLQVEKGLEFSQKAETKRVEKCDFEHHMTFICTHLANFRGFLPH